MKDTAKSLADTLVKSLGKKGCTLSKGAALDVLAELHGTKGWNALSAVLMDRRENGALRSAVIALLGAMQVLAEFSGDVPEWNEGGIAREACVQARKALGSEAASSAPESKLTPDFGKDLLEELAKTPLENEFCLEANEGLQSWDDLGSLYNALEYFVMQARSTLQPEASKALVELAALLQGNKVQGDFLDDAVHDLAGSYAERVASSLQRESARESAYDRWSERASSVNNMGLVSQLQFLLDGYGVQKTRELVKGLLKDLGHGA